ncbi:MAG TPA: hypothetical protein GX699_02670 [Firmicutes bacterium]|nr:hypothetical protein [Bacillota bacterium]
MKIGIPRAFLYYRYKELWETFFHELGIDYVVSPETGPEIVRTGSLYAIDEACLSAKVYLGHVEWLIGKCDYILVPRIAGLGAGAVCSKFQAIYDVVANTFRERKIKLAGYNLAPGVKEGEMAAFIRLGQFCGRKKAGCVLAYMAAKQAEKQALWKELQEQESLLQRQGIKVLVVGHRYNVADKFIGEPVLQYLRELGVIPVPADIVPRKKAVLLSAEMSETLPWAFAKELVGSVVFYRERVDGLLILSTFPCGPDSLVNEMLLRRVKDKPVLNLVLDGHEAMAGIETRLESFFDIICMQKGETSVCL